VPMSDAVAHRGPDDAGRWSDASGRLHFGHRRLSINDLSPAGRQPMSSVTGRFHIVYNGEIYNFKDLRDELSRLGHHFRGLSDTEVLLAACEEWGVQPAVTRCVGMFAFAIADTVERALWMARDRTGEKPLYYGFHGKHFTFASELKALLAIPQFNRTIDPDAETAFFDMGYVPAPLSIYREVRKLPAGCLLHVKYGDGSAITHTAPFPYWSVLAAARAGVDDPFMGTEAEAFAETEKLLNSAVRAQLVADVPLGAFLSGGIDSSAIVALMQENSARQTRTFTIGFSEADYDEAPMAREVAKALRTDHSEFYVGAKAVLDVISAMPAIYDEPFSDASMLPTYLLARLTRNHVTVALSGDGGDEAFAGYSRYLVGEKLIRGIRLTPLLLRRLASRCLRSGSDKTWAGIERVLRNYTGVRPSALRDKAGKMARALVAKDSQAIYDSLVRHEGGELRIAAQRKSSNVHNPQDCAFDLISDMMLRDQVSYLPDDVLVKVDRAAMAAGLETRAPFLDHRLIEFAWRLPLRFKMHGGVGKRPVRAILEKRMPMRAQGGKRGFSVPIGRWLRGELRGWAEALLDPGKLVSAGFCESSIRRAWQQHLSGARDNQQALWDSLMYLNWRAACVRT